MIVKQDTWKMFNQIAPRYDLLNRMISFGTDQRWRKKVIGFFPKKTGLRYCDIGTGTGDLLLTAIDCLGVDQFKACVGVDLADQMLEKARSKAKRFQLPQFIHGSALDLPFWNHTFDVATMAFSIRNVSSPEKALRELYRVLDTHGRAIILEFSLPQNELIRKGYLVYFRSILPRIGGLISGNYSAYQYLNSSVEAFPYGDAFLDLMKKVGFTSVQAIPLSMGVATIYVGIKPT